MAYFTGYYTSYFDVGEAVAAVVEQATGGWDTIVRWERRMRAERKRLEEAVDEEIAALLKDEEPVPAESVAPDYLAELRAHLAAAEARDAQFREFMADKQARDDLRRLLAAEKAMREWIRQRREDEETLYLLLLVA